MADDPTLSAYLNALGFDQQQQLAWSQAAQQQGQVQATYDLAMPQLWRDTAQAQQGERADAMGRGIFSSGESARNMADVNTAAQQHVAQLNLSKDQGMQDIAMSLARQLSGIDVGRNTATWNWNQYQQSKDAAATGGDPYAAITAYYQQLLNQYQQGGQGASPGGNPLAPGGGSYGSP